MVVGLSDTVQGLAGDTHLLSYFGIAARIEYQVIHQPEIDFHYHPPA